MAISSTSPFASPYTPITVLVIIVVTIILIQPCYLRRLLQQPPSLCFGFHIVFLLFLPLWRSTRHGLSFLLGNLLKVLALGLAEVLLQPLAITNLIRRALARLPVKETFENQR